MTRRHTWTLILTVGLLLLVAYQPNAVTSAQPDGATEPAYRLYLPLVFYTEPPPLHYLAAPLTRFYQITSNAETFTATLELQGTVRAYEWTEPRGYANVALYNNAFGPKTERLLLVFATPELEGREIISAVVQVDMAFAYAPESWPTVPAYASQAHSTAPATPSAGFTAGNWERETAWPFTRNTHQGIWCQPTWFPVTLTAGGAEIGIAVRSGVEDRPDLWAGLTYYIHTATWGAGVCPTSALPQLHVWYR